METAVTLSINYFFFDKAIYDFKWIRIVYETTDRAAHDQMSIPLNIIYLMVDSISSWDLSLS